MEIDSKDIINYSNLSRLLAGNRDSIRQDRYPNKYKAVVLGLESVINSYLQGEKLYTSEQIKAKIVEVISDAEF
jgi:hypothetical protein